MNSHLLLSTQNSSNNKEITLAKNNDRLSDDQSLLVQYNNLKYRLDQIDKKVDTINTTLSNILSNDNSKFIFAKNPQNFIENSIFKSLIKNKNNFFIFILWSLSILVALFSHRFKIF